MPFDRLKWIYRAWRYRYRLEPQPLLAKRLRRLAAANAYDHVVVENPGLSSSSGTLVLTEARPCLLFECERRHRKSGRVDDVFAWLRALDHRGYFIDRGGPRDIEEFDPAKHQSSNDNPGYINNFMFVSPARVAA